MCGRGSPRGAKVFEDASAVAGDGAGAVGGATAGGAVCGLVGVPACPGDARMGHGRVHVGVVVAIGKRARQERKRLRVQ